MTSGEIPVFLFELAVLVGVVLTLRNTPKGLTTLGSTARIYVLITVCFHVASFNFVGRSWDSANTWIYIAAVFYLAVTDVIPLLRQRASLPSAEIKGTMIRFAPMALGLVVFLSGYTLWISSTIPREIRELRTVPYHEMLEIYGVPASENYNWENELQIY